MITKVRRISSYLFEVLLAVGVVLEPRLLCLTAVLISSGKVVIRDSLRVGLDNCSCNADDGGVGIFWGSEMCIFLYIWVL